MAAANRRSIILMDEVTTSFLLFLSELEKAELARLECAFTLAESKLAKRSRIDVFAEDKFWEARITKASRKGFAFKYIGKKVIDHGFVRRKDFLETWRFPVKTARQVARVKILAMAEV
jgi:hypothetical protein